jgi:CopG family nickel-responsive transcriptional regulator
MPRLVRFGVAMEKDLLERFDALIEEKGYENRSEALRDLARRELDRQAWHSGKPAVATIMLVYDHHVRELTERLTEIQHDFGECIMSALHVHLDHHHCLEVIAAKGPSQKLKLLAERLTLAKGVLSGDVIAAEIPAQTAKKHRHRHG